MSEVKVDKYIGDGVYVGFDGYHVIVSTNIPTMRDDIPIQMRGLLGTNTIYLDIHAAYALKYYIETVFNS